MNVLLNSVLIFIAKNSGDLTAKIVAAYLFNLQICACLDLPWKWTYLLYQYEDYLSFKWKKKVTVIFWTVLFSFVLLIAFLKKFSTLMTVTTERVKNNTNNNKKWTYIWTPC